MPLLTDCFGAHGESYAQNWCTCRVEGGGATLVKWVCKDLVSAGKEKRHHGEG